jgi:hypothetical protein
MLRSSRRFVRAYQMFGPAAPGMNPYNYSGHAWLVQQFGGKMPECLLQH